MAIALKEKWDHLATAWASSDDEDQDDADGAAAAQDAKHEKYKQLQQRIDEFRAR